MANLAYGTLTITNLSIVTSVDVYYYNSTSPTNLLGDEWSTDTPTWTDGKYVWSKTVTTWEQNVTTQSEPVCITGQKGSTGAAGQSVTRITQQYALSSDPDNAPTTGWSTTMQPFETGKYYWTRSEIVWANPTSTTYTTAVLANGITSANTTAATANSNASAAVSTANSANTKSDTAISTANTANQTAQNAVSVANGKSTIYYSSSKPTGGTYKAGDTWFYLTDDGYRIYEYDTTSSDWVQKSMDGKSITAGTVTAAQIQAGAIVTSKLATDAIKSTNYQAGTAPYSAAGTFLDLSNGNIYSPNFGINNSNDNITDGAYIKGSIYAYNGTIGSNITGNNANYWYIGNYYDYNQLTSAYIKGHGTATIQLGNTSTWRLNTNRIHTAWNDDSQEGEAYKLHYPIYDSKYWDMGLHVPTSKTDKFIYIRNSSSSTALSNLQNSINDQTNGTNNYWNYQFYITSEGILSAKSLKTINNTFEVTDGGSLYARNIYIKDENGALTQIGGTDAAYLSKTGGTITGDLIVGNPTPGDDQQYNGNLRVISDFLNRSGNNITLQTNLASTAAATLTGNSTSPISIGVTGTLPTSKGGTGNTSYNAGGIVYADNSNPKKLLSTATGTPGYLLKSNGTGAPTWIDPGTLTVAAATKATQDGDGNVIKNTYLKLTGGDITGSVSFGDSVTIDDLSVEALTVTGDASFTNNIQANTINDVEVGSNPKFTDTVTTITTEGSGNAITSIEATNGALIATKGSTFLTGITSQSVTNALGYTPYNATNPNGYTTNTGTVTEVAASGTKGITISGSPITESGTITIGLNLSTAINGLGEGTSPANRNDYAVVQYAGGGTTTTTYHRRKLSNVFKALIADDIPNLAWSKITSENDDLKAIEALTGTTGLLKKTAANKWALDTTAYVPNTRTVNGHALSDNISITKSDIGLSNVENALQIIDIGSNDSGQLVLTFGDNTTETRTVSITATTSSSVAKAEALNTNGSSIGDTKTPVYFNSDGKPVALGYTIEKSVPSDAVFSYTFDGTYNASSNKAATVSTVTNAINALDGGTIGTGGAGKTITSLSQANGQVSATFSNISITKSQVSDFSHSHGNILNGGTIISTAVAMGDGDSLLFSDSSNSEKIEKSSITIGTGTTKYLRQDGTWGTPAGTYSLPLASSSTRGGVKIGYSTSGKNYAVQLSSEKMYVNVPWTDTTYDAATATPLMDGTAAVGTSEKYARQDHKHPSDTSRVPITRTINNHALDENITITKSDIGLGNVENRALSTWAGSSNLTTTAVGTLGSAAVYTATDSYLSFADSDGAGYLPTVGAIGRFLDVMVANYDETIVHINNEETVIGRKTFNDLATTTFKSSSGSEYCNINYDQTLSALVFSFG